MEDTSKPVSNRTKQHEEANRMRSKAEPVVWTDRMLQALAKGVKGGKWYSLMDKIARVDTLREAFGRVKANEGAPGVDHVTIEDWERHLESNLERLASQLDDGSYEPRAVRRTWIPKPGRNEERPLGIPAVEDRVVQMACKMVIEPIYEIDFAEQSYGFRPQRGAKDALRRVHRLLKRGRTWVVDADLKGYFDTIPHDQLMARVAEKISDGRVLELVEMFLNQEVVDGDERWQPEKGTPQGGVISPLLANLYLDPLDKLTEERGYEMVRYADDFVILCKDEEEARRALKLVKEWTDEAEPTLHPEKTTLGDALEKPGFEFLGYHFVEGRKHPRDKQIEQLKAVLREYTKRTSGKSIRTTVEEINPILKGWFEYFQHCRGSKLKLIDRWVRRRLRGILRKQQGLSGCVTGRDNRRWTNNFLASFGLFSMVTAHRRLKQSLLVKG